VKALLSIAVLAQTFNFGTGIVGSASERLPGSMFTYAIGADFPMADRWTVRIEAFRRLPDSRVHNFETGHYTPGIPRASPSTIEEHSIADVATLVRFGSSRDRALQFGALAGLDVQAVNVKDRAWVPLSPENPTGVLETMREELRFDTVFDVGADVSVRVDDRWTLTVFGIAGLQPPYNEDKRPQLRAGVLARRSF
jgi:hypothetical protein